MPDRRVEILKAEHRRGPDSITEDGYSQWVLNAMDEYMKECALELLTYVNEKTTTSDIDSFGQLQFQLKEGGHWVTKEQLFENFL
jgi:hypothetical protein